MNCLIVDDEVLAQDVLAHYIDKLDFLHLTGRCNNALQAFAALNKEQTDVMFLDIKMPEMSGLDLVKSLKNPPKIILTTAFDEYALEGYELDIVDYLLKPIRFDRFLKAVMKVQHSLQPSGSPSSDPSPDNEFYVRSDRKLVRIDPKEIIYIESLKNYLSINTVSQKIMVHSTLTNLENELNGYPYLQRIHKSFIINTRFVAEIDNSIVRLKNKTELPIGGSYKDSVLQTMRIFTSG